MVVPHTFPDKMYKMLLCGVKVQSIRGLFTKNDDTKGVSYFELFRFATSFEYFLIFLAVVFTALKAFTFPVMVLIYGEFTTLLIERTYRNGTSSKTYYLQLFGGGRVLKQITRIRVKYFSSIIRQEVGWFDCASSDSNVAVRISEDIERIRDAIGEKVSHFLHLLFAFLILISFAFSHGWKLTLVVISYTPFLFASNSIAARFQTLFSTKESDAGAVASSVSEEVLGGIRTVVAFGGEEKEKQRYSELLLPAQKAALRRAASTGIGEGIMKFLILGSNSLAYWFGFLLVFADRNDIDKEYTSAVLMIVFLDLGIGGDFLYMMKPFLESFAIARGAAATVFKIIDRKSKIDPMSKSGGIINLRGEGDIEFQDVGFSYPSRTDTKILNRLNVKFMNGQTVALVGSSGNGKSTCLQLLQRFYDPTEGRILIDGHDIKDLNLSWWRSNIAFVGQEPALFATTIEENIRYANPNATRNEIEVSAKLAGAHHFITQLQDGYETLVGERGCQLSGGQKQRIAIARALIKNPKILLLDEATSALDSHSEKLVQDALNKASKGRTTIVVSHRLSAIYNADKILFIENGRVVEAGTHDELINLKGSYYKMMRSNKKGSENALQTAVDDDAIPKDKIERFILGFQQPQDSRKEAAIAKTELRVWSVLKRILLMAKPERSFFMVAIIAAIVIGLGSAVPSIFFGEFFAALGKVDSDETRETVRFISFGFVALGITMGFMAFLRIYMINKGGVFLVSRVQTKAFNAMMSQEMAWFDDVDNSVGALSARLTGDASNIRSTIGYPLCEMMHLAFGLVFGMAVSFFYSWKLALVVSPITPLIILTVFVEKKCTENAEEASKQGIAEIVRVATESILNIRTVTSLRQEPHMIARYSTEADKDEKEIRKKLSFRGAIYSIGQIIPLIAYVISVTYGGTLVADEGLNSKALIIVSEAMLISFYMLGEMLVFSPAITSALYAAHSLFQIIDRQSRVKAPAYSPVIHDVSRKQDEKSDILFKQIRFNYPTRPNINILQNLNLNILEGKTVALVGPSGCGKSTCVQLLQRLYDPDDGQIFIGSDEISRDLTLKELRSKLSIVSQEPILFDRTIGENIAYGDNSRIVVTADIVEAAKMANIHDFIAALPLGYDTRIGSKGTQLSGGQKQRIAIARALVRNPKVLLLDEATSALDIASEKIVQTALDLARTGRTCLVIAHRLSTVENADLICVIQNGIVHEQGTHQQLLTLDGLYSKLYAMEPKA